MERIRIYLTGVGGQGTLTATTLLARAALDEGFDVTSGEIHGMAQRGGVVESTVLLGGWKSPKIAPGEADIVLGFEPLETFRGLPYLKKGGTVLSNTEPIPPIAVSRGLAAYPDIEMIKNEVSCVGTAYFLPILTLGRQAGAAQAGNVAMLAAMCATGAVPFGPDALERAVKKYLKPKIADVNIKAIALGVEAVAA